VRYIVAHDLGTGGNKTVLLGEDGRVASRSFHPYATHYPRPGWAEQEPLDWWRSVVAGTRAVLNSTSASDRRVVSVSLSGHGMGVVPVAEDGGLLSERTMIWMDSRSGLQADRGIQTVGDQFWYETTYCAYAPALFSAFKLRWLLENERALFDRAKVFLPTKGFVCMRLTGQCVSDPSDASFSGLYDARQGEYSTELLEAFDIPRSKLPPVIPSTEIAGELLPAAAEELGLCAGIPVVVGGEDVPCTALGAGVTSGGRGYCYVGSSGWVSVASPVPIPGTATRIPNPVHVVPNMFTPQLGTNSAGSAYAWLRDILHSSDAKTRGDCFEQMEADATSSPVGANGLLFLPTIAGGGEMLWSDPDLRGAFIGISPAHNRADMTRAALEGVGLDLSLDVEEFRAQGVKLDEIRLVGGGAQSRLWKQILADCFCARIEVPVAAEEAAAVGAAVLGGIGVGLWKDFGILDDILAVSDQADPIDKHVAAYDQLRKTYRTTASLLRGPSKELRLMALRS